MAKKTIAIIGATSKMGSATAKIIAKANYRLLLFGYDRKKLNSLAEEIRITNPSVEIDCMDCAANASWEADIIIPAIPFSVQNEIAQKIQTEMTFPGQIKVTVIREKRAVNIAR